MTTEKKEFATAEGPVNWDDLMPHLERGALITVHSDLKLEQVVLALGEDRVGQVKIWMDNNQIGKPSTEQIRLWKEGEQLFMFAIAQPYVLIQALSSEPQKK